MTTETAAKRDIQKLQRAIVDGLEDVKAQDIQVFDTEHLSSLFERVIIASGTSNRQTKALAASAVREAGFAKPRIEGEANGEWIIVDCSQAVVHIMQPTFRAYYHLEELWGEKPVRLKFGASKPAVKVVEAKAPAGKATGRKTVASKTAAGKSVAAKSATGKGAAGKSAKPPARKPAPAPARAPAAKLPVKRVVVNSAPAKKSATGARKPAARKPAARKP